MIRAKYSIAVLSIIMSLIVGGGVAYAQTTGTQLLDDILQQINNPSATSTSVATGFSRDGVYGCTGAQYGAVGMQGPGGAHVPVFDDATFDQSRLVTYKECLLDGIVNSMRETLISFIIKSIVRWTNQGFEGNPSYVTNLPLHMLERISDPVAEHHITGNPTAIIPEPFRRDVRVALAKQYSTQTRRPNETLRCNLDNNQIIALQNNDFYGAGGWQSIGSLMFNPGCNATFSYLEAQNQLNAALAGERERERTELRWGNGFRSVERERNVDLGPTGNSNIRRIVTPGFMIAEHLRQTLGTGLRQSENADEIDEIISALMSNLGTEMLTDLEGLSGLSASFGGQAPYIDRLAADSSARTRGNLTGAGAAVINNSIRVEQEYTQARQSAAATLLQSRSQLESWERICWNEILDQAEVDLRDRVEEAACQSQGATTTPCGVSVTVTKGVSTDAIALRAVSATAIVVRGRATDGGSTVDVSASGGGAQAGPLSPQVTSSGDWLTSELELANIPDSTISVVAIETLAGGAGTLGPITAQVQKVTTPSGVELTLPTQQPPVTITATASNGTSQSIQIATSTARSRTTYNQNILPLLQPVREQIVIAQRALEVVAQLSQALQATNSASAQRFILERIDQLVAARALHTEAQLRQARDQATQIQAAMEQLLQETRDSWEAGWCRPENWEALAT